MITEDHILKTRIVFIACISLNLSIVDNANASEECYYNPTAITYEYFLENTGFKNAVWDDSKKLAKVSLKDKDEEVLVQFHTCRTTGITATYKMKRTDERLNSAFLLNKIVWLGSKVLASSDYEQLKSSLERNKVFRDSLDLIRSKERVFLSIEETNYQSFMVYVVDYKNDFYIEISWYM